MREGLAALALQAETVFRLDARLRIVGENDPDSSRGPLAFVGGCPGGVLVRLHVDVSAADAAEAERLAGSAPWSDTAADPPWLDPLMAGLRATAVERSRTYALDQRAMPVVAGLVRSDAPEGAALVRQLERDGVPTHLLEAGFVSVGDFWAPWCALEEDGEIAAIAFAARQTVSGAEVGVYTFPPWRGRGLAATVTAAWSALPELADRTLFYSTTIDNLASQRVAARLGLTQIGASLRLT